MVDRTFLFSDIEGSTRAWESGRESMTAWLEVHDTCLIGAVEGRGGTVVKHTGDGVLAVFNSAADGVAAAVAAQLALSAATWPGTSRLRVRIGVHSGAARRRGDDWFGPTLNRCARLMAAGHGGQVLCSAQTAALARGESAAEIGFVALGEFRLKDLAEPMPLVQVTHPALTSEFPPLRTLDVTAGNLPFRLPRLIGRDAELRGLVKELVPGSAITVVGPGGIGKTRLALAVAAEAVTGFEDGAWLVDLSARREPNDVVTAVADALSVPEQAGTDLRAALCASVVRRRLLIVLDNCEHLIAAAAALVEDLLASAPGVAVLATSREPLGVSGELVRTLGPLDTDDDWERSESPAVELLLERARDAGAEPDMTIVSTRAAIMDICARVDGLPLAIELAAGRCMALHPTEIARRLGDRLNLLTGGRRNATARHRTLTATIDWSYELLDEPQRMLFRRLGVFTGSFTLDAVEEICALDGCDIVGLLADLVVKSMVTVAGTRYRLLETLRAYAAARLDGPGERAALEAAEAERCVALVREVASGLKGPDEPEWADLMADELDNVRACWRRAVAAENTDTALGCFAPLPEFNGLAPAVTQELASWAEPTLSLPGARAHPLYVGACLLASRGRYNAFDLQGAQDWLDRAEAAGPAPAQFAAALSVRRALLASLAGSRHDSARHIANACAVTDPSDLYERAYIEGFELFLLSPIDPDLAAARYPAALAAAKAVGGPHLVTLILTSMAELFLFYTRPTRAHLCIALAREALELGARCRNPQFVTSAISKMAADGHHPEALRTARDLLVADQRRGYRQQLWWHLRCLLIACYSRHLYLRYAQLTGAVYHGPLDIGLAPTVNELEAQATVRKKLGSEPYDDAMKSGEHTDTDAVIRLALDTIDELIALPASG